MHYIILTMDNLLKFLAMLKLILYAKIIILFEVMYLKYIELCSMQIEPNDLRLVFITCM